MIFQWYFIDISWCFNDVQWYFIDISWCFMMSQCISLIFHDFLWSFMISHRSNSQKQWFGFELRIFFSKTKFWRCVVNNQVRSVETLQVLVQLVQHQPQNCKNCKKLQTKLPSKTLTVDEDGWCHKTAKIAKKKCKKCRLKLPSNPYRWRGWMMQVHSLNFCPCEASVVVRRRFWRVTKFTVGSLGMAAANQRFTFSRSRSSCCNPSQTPDMAGRAPSQDQLLRRCEISGLQS